MHSRILLFVESGNYLALDLGGTNFRVLLIRLNGGQVEMQSTIYMIPEVIMTGTGLQVPVHVCENYGSCQCLIPRLHGSCVRAR